MTNTCPETTRLIAELSAILSVADRLGFNAAAMHIDEAVMAPGGAGTPPPVDR